MYNEFIEQERKMKFHTGPSMEGKEIHEIPHSNCMPPPPFPIVFRENSRVAILFPTIPEYYYRNILECLHSRLSESVVALSM